MRVERRVVDRPVTAADADAFEETVIDVPLRRETVDVQKQRVAEEVVVGKEAVQHTERVDTVRKEEVFVDEDATLIDDREGRTGTTPTIWTSPPYQAQSCWSALAAALVQRQGTPFALRRQRPNPRTRLHRPLPLTIVSSYCEAAPS